MIGIPERRRRQHRRQPDPRSPRSAGRGPGRPRQGVGRHHPSEHLRPGLDAHRCRCHGDHPRAQPDRHRGVRCRGGARAPDDRGGRGRRRRRPGRGRRRHTPRHPVAGGSRPLRILAVRVGRRRRRGRHRARPGRRRRRIGPERGRNPIGCQHRLRRAGHRQPGIVAVPGPTRGRFGRPDSAQSCGGCPHALGVDLLGHLDGADPGVVLRDRRRGRHADTRRTADLRRRRIPAHAADRHDLANRCLLADRDHRHLRRHPAVAGGRRRGPRRGDLAAACSSTRRRSTCASSNSSRLDDGQSRRSDPRRRMLTEPNGHAARRVRQPALCTAFPHPPVPAARPRRGRRAGRRAPPAREIDARCDLLLRRGQLCGSPLAGRRARVRSPRSGGDTAAGFRNLSEDALLGRAVARRRRYR
jgi:hypothetical protein